MNELPRRRLTRTSLSALLLSSLIVGTVPLAGTASAQVDAATAASTNAAAADPVRAPVENLGRPFAKAGAYAQNVWDMQLWNGKIYIGQGNSSNEGSSPNAGPVPLTAYDPASQTFKPDTLSLSSTVKQTYIDEEQIDAFRVLNNQLYIPGHDARKADLALGNFYRLDPSNGFWYKFRTVPEGVHVFDMASYNGQLFAAIGSSSVPDILMSGDKGKTWTALGKTGHPMQDPRNYALFQLGGKLYGSSSYVVTDNDAYRSDSGVLEISPAPAGSTLPVQYRQIEVTADDLFPGVTPSTQVPYYLVKVVRPTPIGQKLLYIGGQKHNDQQWLPKGLFVASSLSDAARVTLPGGATAMDILTRGSKVYVLAYTESGGTYTNLVFEADAAAIGNPSAWTETVRFRQNTFARSFELQGGDFYFGLGTHDANNPVATAGTILRIQDVISE